MGSREMYVHCEVCVGIAEAFDFLRDSRAPKLLTYSRSINSSSKQNATKIHQICLLAALVGAMLTAIAVQPRQRPPRRRANHRGGTLLQRHALVRSLSFRCSCTQSGTYDEGGKIVFVGNFAKKQSSLFETKT